MWLTSGCRLGIQEGKKKRKKTQRSRTDELDARVIDEGGDDKNRDEVSRFPCRISRTHLSLSQIVRCQIVASLDRREGYIALIEEGRREELVGS